MALGQVALLRNKKGLEMNPNFNNATVMATVEGNHPSSRMYIQPS